MHRAASRLTRGDGDAAEQLAELLIVAHGELDVAGDDAGLLVVARRISGQLQDLGCQVLQHCRDRRSVSLMRAAHRCCLPVEFSNIAGLKEQVLPARCRA